MIDKIFLITRIAFIITAVDFLISFIFTKQHVSIGLTFFNFVINFITISIVIFLFKKIKKTLKNKKLKTITTTNTTNTNTNTNVTASNFNSQAISNPPPLNNGNNSISNEPR